MFVINKNKLICLFVTISTIFIFPTSSIADKYNWNNIVKEASGQTVYFHAWGGAKNINTYINWAAETVKKTYNITVKHVKISDTSNVVSRILAEKNAKNNKNGAVDLVWINGENFSSMKRNNLLLKENWVIELPNSKFLDFKNNPSLLNDFGIPTDGMEMPWGV